jgi:DNA (cytosine-5)-methyltransferase 1
VSKPKAIDLFCGAGGATKGLQRSGFHVAGVDIKPQPRYCGDVFMQVDALTVDLNGYDFIWASPPCQAFTAMKVMPNAREHLDLLTPTRERLLRKGTPFVIENVLGAPIKVSQPSLFSSVMGIILCGSMFGLENGTYELRRHRLFESSVPLMQPACRHRLAVIGFYGDHARTRQRTVKGHRDRGGDITGREEKLRLVKELMGIDWMEWHESNQAIPPAYSEFIGLQIMASQKQKAA